MTAQWVGNLLTIKGGDSVSLEDEISTLDHCMKCALRDGVVFAGSEGHDFRIAIAIKALKIGMLVDEVVSLFENQPNYDPKKSRKHVAYIASRHYQQYSCKTLLDKCGSIVSKYCATCPLNQRSSTAIEAQ